MNCFQICIFVLIATTSHTARHTFATLWIAFKFVSLYWSQQRVKPHRSLVVVVNCFQICIFVLIATTFLARFGKSAPLWIAFKFVSLYWSQQPNAAGQYPLTGCELLSNLYLCTDRNNLCLCAAQPCPVVNCFQICIFVLIATTCSTRQSSRSSLWIAFKFVSLYWSQQLTKIQVLCRCRCELLSNLYLCTDRNNNGGCHQSSHVVVNCFQICIFVLIATTDYL